MIYKKISIERFWIFTLLWLYSISWMKWLIEHKELWDSRRLGNISHVKFRHCPSQFSKMYIGRMIPPTISFPTNAKEAYTRNVVSLTPKHVRMYNEWYTNKPLVAFTLSYVSSQGQDGVKGYSNEKEHHWIIKIYNIPLKPAKSSWDSAIFALSLDIVNNSSIHWQCDQNQGNGKENLVPHHNLQIMKCKLFNYIHTTLKCSPFVLMIFFLPYFHLTSFLEYNISKTLPLLLSHHF